MTVTRVIRELSAVGLVAVAQADLQRFLEAARSSTSIDGKALGVASLDETCERIARAYGLG